MIAKLIRIHRLREKRLNIFRISLSPHPCRCRKILDIGLKTSTMVLKDAHASLRRASPSDSMISLGSFWILLPVREHRVKSGAIAAL